MTPQPSPTNLSAALENIIGKGLGWSKYDQPEDYEMSPFGGMWVSSDGKSGYDITGIVSAITAAYAEAINEIIGEDAKPDFDDDDWFCQRCSFGPTDGSKDCICKYNNRLKRRQRQRLQDLLTNGKDE